MTTSNNPTYKEFADALNEDMMRPIKTVYIDLPYIQDIFLGGILLEHMNEDEYLYILDCLSKYNERFTLTHTEHFPKLTYSEEQLQAYLKDSNNVDKVLLTSPMTDIFIHLPEFHKSLTTHNERVLEEKEQPTLQYIINTYPLKLTNEQMLIIKERFRFVSTDITLGIVSAPISNLPKSLYKDVDIWFIYDISGLFKDDTVGKKSFITKLELRNASVYSPKRIGEQKVLDDIPFLKKEEIIQVFADTVLVLNLYTEFNYLDSTIRITEDK